MLGDGDEIRASRMQKGQAARQIKSVIADRVLDQEENILTALIGKMKSGKLTETEAREGVAQIAALHDLMASIDTDIKLGDIASEEELGEKTEGRRRRG